MSAAVANRPAFLQDLDTIRVLWRRDVLRFLRQPSRIVGALGQPIIFWGVIGSGMAATFRLPAADVGYLEYFFPGVLLMIVLFASIFSTLSVIEDRHAGFLHGVLASPGSRTALVLGKALGSTTVALIQAGLFLVFAPWAGFPPGQISWGALLLALFGTSLALTALGVGLAWLLDNVQAFHAVQMTLLVPAWIVSGAMFPAPQSGVLGAVVRANPLSFAVEAVRGALYGGAWPAGFEPRASLGVCLGVVAVGAVACVGLAVAIVERRR